MIAITDTEGEVKTHGLIICRLSPDAAGRA